MRQDMTRRAAAAFMAVLLVAALSGCTESGDREAGNSAAVAPAAGATQTKSPAASKETAPQELSAELLDAYRRGLEKEFEILNRPGRGSHYGVTLSKYSDEAAEVVEAAGLSLPVYQSVHGQVDKVFTTLNFQGHIGPPRSINVERAPEWKARLASDPFAELSPASAAALRKHMEELVPAWSAIVTLTAQNG